MNLCTLTDDELMNRAHIEFDPITGTALEAELLRRFEENAAVTADNEPLLEVLAKRGLEDPIALNKALETLSTFDEFPAAKELLDVLSDFDIDDPATLKKVLDRNAKFEDLKNDLADPLASLQELITSEA